METTLPKIIEAYIQAKNAHNVDATLDCFSEAKTKGSGVLLSQIRRRAAGSPSLHTTLP